MRSASGQSMASLSIKSSGAASSLRTVWPDLPRSSPTCALHIFRVYELKSGLGRVPGFFKDLKRETLAVPVNGFAGDGGGLASGDGPIALASRAHQSATPSHPPSRTGRVVDLEPGPQACM
jgi:hypothetical protein